ncbi:ARM repeat-containing protein [Neocallimastix lanati (nom. inval.)]|jgi:translation initiation factor 3 subunit K|uniref:Eukaryotic translation initiation factor 3 subunit K n=1 Tax=Neocallimastix californiae TaxID=1754190 RepID=A0A1Y2D5S8_9FUNG|nr:ARM repeat-containing protein [Neocallimastix sp. JGI-2020a]ORY54633.1 ARM repeat-containing protein [Neocallimastix californiae]|eukprot:ORY54633.1 ARM repeat-containing protein [Neocallimastix californiae]
MSSNIPSRPKQINDIIETVERYDTEKIPLLHEYIDEQLANKVQYDSAANLAVLKLYQFNPDQINFKYISAILIKALTALPDPDFNLCLALLNIDICADPTISRLYELQKALEQCRFKDFWTLMGDGETRNIVECCVGFENSIREFISRTIENVFVTITKEEISGYLNLNGNELDEYAKSRNWVLNDNVYTLPVVKENENKPKIVKENVNYEQLTQIIGYANEI